MGKGIPRAKNTKPFEADAKQLYGKPAEVSSTDFATTCQTEAYTLNVKTCWHVYVYVAVCKLSTHMCMLHTYTHTYARIHINAYTRMQTHTHTYARDMHVCVGGLVCGVGGGVDRIACI